MLLLSFISSCGRSFERSRLIHRYLGNSARYSLCVRIRVVFTAVGKGRLLAGEGLAPPRRWCVEHARRVVPTCCSPQARSNLPCSSISGLLCARSKTLNSVMANISQGLLMTACTLTHGQFQLSRRTAVVSTAAASLPPRCSRDRRMGRGASSQQPCRVADTTTHEVEQMVPYVVTETTTSGFGRVGKLLYQLLFSFLS